MTLFGVTITRTKAIPAGLQSVSSRSGWFSVLESFPGAWQRNIEITTEDVLTFPAVYACVTLIATDIAKLRIKLVEQDADGIWHEVDRASPFWPVLRKPNHYQTRIQFYEHWMLSKLIQGNAYMLLQRDQRGVVTAMYVLDPMRVQPLVAPDGSVYYRLSQDLLSAVSANDVVVPASEIIHDRMPALYHPLCGVSPITACGLAAMQGLRIEQHGAKFFENAALPGGLLMAPGTISEENEARMKELWEQNYSGSNYGRIAVLGDGMKFEPMAMMKAVDAQLIDQLKMSAEMVCTAYKVPAYKVGVGPAPAYNNIEALDQQYYGQCLQTHFESIELLLDEGLGLSPLGTEFELDDLLRMDTATRVKAAADGVGSGAVAPNEARLRWLDLGPVTGGDTPYLQVQNYSLSALDARDRAKGAPESSGGNQLPASSPAPTLEAEQAKTLQQYKYYAAERSKRRLVGGYAPAL